MIDAATLKMRYPAFRDAANANVNYWLTDAARTVDATWGEDQESATLALAAHNLALSGALAGPTAQIPAGVTRFHSGSMDVSLSEAVVTAQARGGYDATRYGAEFAVMLRRNRGGAKLIDGVGFACPGMLA